jgi:hypothetical protein
VFEDFELFTVVGRTTGNSVPAPVVYTSQPQSVADALKAKGFVNVHDKYTFLQNNWCVEVFERLLSLVIYYDGFVVAARKHLYIPQHNARETKEFIDIACTNTYAAHEIIYDGDPFTLIIENVGRMNKACAQKLLSHEGDVRQFMDVFDIVQMGLNMMDTNRQEIQSQTKPTRYLPGLPRV